MIKETLKISEIFDVTYGVNLELNKLIKCHKNDTDTVNFVSRTEKNNGVSAIVKKISDIAPNPANTLSVAGGGSVLSTFLQPKPYYSGRDLYVLVPKYKMSETELLFHAYSIRKNKYRYNYGRQANKTLGDLEIPKYMPEWALNKKIPDYSYLRNKKIKEEIVNFDSVKWRAFRYEELFNIKKGKRLTKADMEIGKIPFIGAIDSNNGYRQYIKKKPIHSGKTITVNYNGSVAEAFYQPAPFWASDDVNVLYPRFLINEAIALFITTIIKKEKYRYNFGRKWHLKRMRKSIIKLPVKEDDSLHLEYMENYILSLPYSINLENSNLVLEEVA